MSVGKLRVKENKQRGKREKRGYKKLIRKKRDGRKKRREKECKKETIWKIYFML